MVSLPIIAPFFEEQTDKLESETSVLVSNPTFDAVKEEIDSNSLLYDSMSLPAFEPITEYQEELPESNVLEYDSISLPAPESLTEYQIEAFVKEA